MVTYGTTAIPSDQITVISGGTVSVSAAFDNTIGLVGGMDTTNGTANTGEVTRVSSPSDASDKFGDGSELHEAVQLAFQNGAGTVWALGVPETEVTAETQSSQSGTLDNAPVFDPRVNEEHSLAVTDTSGSATVNLVDEPPETAPSETDQVDVYPPTGEYYADSAPDGDYEFDYSNGDYSATAMDPLLDKSPRIVAVLTENESVTNTLATELNSRAKDFDLMHGVTNAQVGVSDVPNYTNAVDERRISMVYPARGYTDDAETNEERTAAAVGGYLSGLALGLSSTNDGVGGFTGLKNPLSGPSEAGTMRDAGVLPLLNYGGDQGITIVQDMTTSTEPKFERVYAMQIVDEMTELSHLISREFVGEQNTEANRQSLRRSHVNAYLGAENGTPPLLDDFVVNVSQDPNDPNKVDVEVGLDVVDVMDTVSVTISVGNIVRNQGAA
jgi:hypothetical protein